MNKEIKPNETFLIRKDNNSHILTINRVHPSHKGTYEFVCFNDYGQSNAKIEIEVLGEESVSNTNITILIIIFIFFR
jgi:hypothetical protein